MQHECALNEHTVHIYIIGAWSKHNLDGNHLIVAGNDQHSSILKLKVLLLHKKLLTTYPSEVVLVQQLNPLIRRSGTTY